MPTQSEVAQHLDLQTRHVRLLWDEGAIPDPRGASLDELRVAYIRHLRESAAGRGSSTVDLAAARARQALEQTHTAELKNAELTRDLVRRREVVETWTTRIRACRNKLRGIASRAQTLIPGVTAPMARQLLGLIDEALVELAGPGDGGEPERPGRRRSARKRRSAVGRSRRAGVAAASD